MIKYLLEINRIQIAAIVVLLCHWNRAPSWLNSECHWTSICRLITDLPFHFTLFSVRAAHTSAKRDKTLHRQTKRDSIQQNNYIIAALSIAESVHLVACAQGTTNARKQTKPTTWIQFFRILQLQTLLFNLPPNRLHSSANLIQLTRDLCSFSADFHQENDWRRLHHGRLRQDLASLDGKSESGWHRDAETDRVHVIHSSNQLNIASQRQPPVKSLALIYTFDFKVWK